MYTTTQQRLSPVEAAVESLDRALPARQSKRGVQFLPYAGGGIHRDSIFESDYRVLARIGGNAIQRSKAAELSPNLTGLEFVDSSVGFLLRKLKSLSGQLNPDSEWVKLAPKFDSKFPVPT